MSAQKKNKQAYSAPAEKKETHVVYSCGDEDFDEDELDPLEYAYYWLDENDIPLEYDSDGNEA